MNCWRKGPFDTNPAHWLMKVNKMFYAAERQRELLANKESSDMLPQFRNLALHQCPSLKGMLSEKAAWPWAKHLFLAATTYWTEVRLWRSLSLMNVIELHGADHNWTCFEDIYFDSNYGSWSPGPKYQRRWLDALKREMVLAPNSNAASLPHIYRTGGHKLTVRTSLRSSLRASQRASLRASLQASRPNQDEVSARKQDNAQGIITDIKDRCTHGSMRIVVFQRTEGTALRRFRNLAEVMSMLSNHTSSPVEVVTVTSRTPVQDQARLFADGFDMLVTPHGSHLANIILCEPNETAMVEVVPAVYDTVFEGNAIQVGFRSYITSTGHRAVCDVCDKYAADKCEVEASTGLRKCAEKNVRQTLLQNDMVVDTNILSAAVGRGLRALCNVTL